MGKWPQSWQGVRELIRTMAIHDGVSCGEVLKASVRVYYNMRSTTEAARYRTRTGEAWPGWRRDGQDQ